MTSEREVLPQAYKPLGKSAEPIDMNTLVFAGQRSSATGVKEFRLGTRYAVPSPLTKTIRCLRTLIREKETIYILCVILGGISR